MKTKTTDQVRYAGVSIQTDPEGKNPKFNFHTSAGDSRMGIWIDPPGQAQFLFVQVPKGMNKIDAARFLIQNNAFNSDAVKAFLERKIIRMIAATSEDVLQEKTLSGFLSESVFSHTQQPQRGRKKAAA